VIDPSEAISPQARGLAKLVRGLGERVHQTGAQTKALFTTSRGSLAAGKRAFRRQKVPF
jgi:hypothetical protein